MLKGVKIMNNKYTNNLILYPLSKQLTINIKCKNL